LAVQNLDLILSATIEASLLPLATPKPQWCDFLDRLSAQSCESYSALVKENSDFVRYFYQGTPLEELALLALGSRPARRGSSDPDAVPSVDDLRAVPWVFAWMQKRLMVPAWLGTDRAFEHAIDGGELDLLRDMYHHWPYFTAQINLLEMVLAKADSDLSAYYDRVLVSDRLQPIGVELRSRLALIIATVNRVKDQDTLLQSEAGIARSLALRDPYSDPLHLLQVELLKRYRDAGDQQPPALAKALLVTITGIAAAMRNTG
jgi:phosphoenolpyruvate carboxylase